MITKIVGAVVIIISSTLIGISKSLECKNRVKYLESMQMCVLQLENEIRYTHTPIFEAFKNVSEQERNVIKNLFISAAEQCNTCDTISNIWSNAVEKNSKNFHKDDITLLSTFGECIGKADIEGTLKHIELFSKKLNLAIGNARGISEKSEKLFKNCGLYLGILIAILLL